MCMVNATLFKYKQIFKNCMFAVNFPVKCGAILHLRMKETPK